MIYIYIYSQYVVIWQYIYNSQLPFRNSSEKAGFFQRRSQDYWQLEPAKWHRSHPLPGASGFVKPRLPRLCRGQAALRRVRQAGAARGASPGQAREPGQNCADGFVQASRAAPPAR